MKKLISLLILIIPAHIFQIFILGLILTSCQKEDPLPYYEVIPVIEITNAYFDNIDEVFLSISLDVDGVSTTQTWVIPYRSISAHRGCSILKWMGEPIEYQQTQYLKLTVEVFYKIDEIGSGYLLLDNMVGTHNYLRYATTIRPYFEVRDKHNPSDKFIGIETRNDVSTQTWQAPSVEWEVGDWNGVPGNQASPQSNLRVAEPEECGNCKWIKLY